MLVVTSERASTYGAKPKEVPLYEPLAKRTRAPEDALARPTTPTAPSEAFPRTDQPSPRTTQWGVNVAGEGPPSPAAASTVKFVGASALSTWAPVGSMATEARASVQRRPTKVPRNATLSRSPRGVGPVRRKEIGPNGPESTWQYPPPHRPAGTVACNVNLPEPSVVAEALVGSHESVTV